MLYHAPACANDCNTSGIKQCSGTGSYQTCGNYDEDSCLEWSSSASCPSGQGCLIDGICISGQYCDCSFYSKKQCNFGEKCNCNWGFASCAAPGVPGCLCSPHHDQYCSVGQACDDSPGGYGCFTPNQIGCDMTNAFGCQADLNCGSGKSCNCNEECASGVCSGGSTCSYGTCTAAGCTKDADCADTSKPYYDPNKPKCNTAKGECVECLSDPDCRNAGKTCVDDSEKYAKCRLSDYTCLRCDPCLSNSDCVDGACCPNAPGGPGGSGDCVGTGIWTDPKWLCAS